MLNLGVKYFLSFFLKECYIKRRRRKPSFSRFFFSFILLFTFNLTYLLTILLKTNIEVVVVEFFRKNYSKFKFAPISQKEKIQFFFVLNVASLFLPTLLILLLVRRKKDAKKSKCERQHGKKKSGKKMFLIKNKIKYCCSQFFFFYSSLFMFFSC